ncbi:MAG: 50S ribosomal protein L21 [Candidatus Ancaeobacter aquaticus]|nr:50S ribosomal protein L21 [Candidatus Ancaeobacter aquaticus]
MFAVVKSGGKQYKVTKGDVVTVEKLDGNPGDTINFEEVLLIADDKKVVVGKPFIENAVVVGELVVQTKGKKLIAYKYKRRKDSSKKIGHRQQITEVKIQKISTEGTQKKEV